MPPVSLRPNTFAQGGGLIDDADVEIVRARFTIGYGNDSGSGNDATTLCLTLKDTDEVEHQQYYSCGNGFVPSETGDETTNGEELVPVGDKTAPSGSSNMAMVIGSLINAGLPEDLLDSGKVSAIEGTRGHVNRIPAPKRQGIVRQGKNADREPTVLVFTTVTGLPGEKPKPGKPKVTTMAKPAAAGAGKSTTAAPNNASADVDEDLKSELAGHLYTVLGEAPDGLKKVQLVPKLFAIIDKADPNKKALLAMAAREDVLGSIDGLEFGGGILKMA